MTESARWFVDVAGEFFSGMGAQTGPILEEFRQKVGDLEEPDMLFIQVAHGFAPEPLAPEHVSKRAPYANPKIYAQQMAEAAERGWLEAVGDGQYRLTDKGKATVKRLRAVVDKAFDELSPLAEVDLARLEGLLSKVVRRVRELPEPSEKWAFSWGEKFEREGAPLIVQVRRRLLDLLAYRDDVHIAAWQPYDVSGQAWEVLTMVWRDQAHTADELVENLPYRHYDRDAYAAALQKVAAWGWIVEQDAKFVVTNEGKQVRQEAEDATDRYFDAPWSILGETETKELKKRLKKLAEAFRPPAQEEE